MEEKKKTTATSQLVHNAYKSLFLNVLDDLPGFKCVIKETTENESSDGLFERYQGVYKARTYWEPLAQAKPAKYDSANGVQIIGPKIDVEGGIPLAASTLLNVIESRWVFSSHENAMSFLSNKDNMQSLSERYSDSVPLKEIKVPPRQEVDEVGRQNAEGRDGGEAGEGDNQITETKDAKDFKDETLAEKKSSVLQVDETPDETEKQDISSPVATTTAPSSFLSWPHAASTFRAFHSSFPFLSGRGDCQVYNFLACVGPVVIKVYIFSVPGPAAIQKGVQTTNEQDMKQSIDDTNTNTNTKANNQNPSTDKTSAENNDTSSSQAPSASTSENNDKKENKEKKVSSLSSTRRRKPNSSSSDSSSSDPLSTSSLCLPELKESTTFFAQLIASLANSLAQAAVSHTAEALSKYPSDLGQVGYSFKVNICALPGCSNTECPNGAGALKRCSRCKAAYYCSRDHQRLDFEQHKPTCRSKQ